MAEKLPESHMAKVIMRVVCEEVRKSRLAAISADADVQHNKINSDAWDRQEEESYGGGFSAPNPYKGSKCAERALEAHATVERWEQIEQYALEMFLNKLDQPQA